MQLVLFISMFSITFAEICKDQFNTPIFTCDRCLWRSDCEWCPDTNSDGVAVGCYKKGTSGCTSSPIISTNPEPQIVQNDPLVNYQIPFVQLSPQEADLELLPYVEKSMKFDVSLADNPVDIYIVMDLSGSMSNLRNSLVDAAIEISNKISTLTSDFKIGFGSYSDKPVAPFAKERHAYEKKGETVPQAYQHRMRLTRDISKFKEAVSLSKLSRNVDSPESGLDAIAQAMTCNNLTGWRGNDIRKVIIVITDQEMHYAFDGILGGIVRKFDMACHTDPVTSEYVMQTELDYPSFGQIRQLREQTETSMIFLVSSSKASWYEEFSRFIQGTENVAFLDDTTNGLSDIIKEQYESIKNSIVVRSVVKTDQIKLRTTSTCSNPDPKDALVCNEVKEKQVISFEASISVTEEFCKQKQGSQVLFQLGGFEKDKLKLNVKCERCECGRQIIQNAPQCMNRGSLVCGGCDCNDGFMGKHCECDLTASSGGLESLNSKCKASNETDQVCNGNGHCNCGSCVCDSKHVGPYCSCDINQCPKGANGQICNGVGLCNVCSDDLKPGCSCNPGWGGLDCSCDLSEDKCRDAMTKEVCFGKGKCKCGQCRCHRGYEGKFCQKSISLSTCAKLEPCITSKIFMVNMTESELESAHDQCKRNTEFQGKKLFGKELNIACRLDNDNSTTFEDDYGEEALQIGYSIDMDCISILEELKNNEDQGQDGIDFDSRNSRVGGDIKPPTALKRSTEGLQYCFLIYAGCEIVYYHSSLESDDFFDPNQKVQPEDTVYIIHRPVYDEKGKNLLSWAPQIRCSEIPVAELMGASGGLLLAIIIIGVIAAIVIINLRDLRAWQKYLAMRQANEANLGNFENPLYEGATTTFANPQCHITKKP